MPRPPSYDGLAEIKFITNYSLMGCAPDLMLLVEFSQAPAADLALLFLELDWFDIAQGVFQPKGNRGRRPGRHGRKKRTGGGFPDPNEFVARGVRAHVNPYDALDFGPVRKAWALFDIYERFNFTMAAIDGVIDVGYETLWGIMEADKDFCPDFPAMSRQDYGGTPSGFNTNVTYQVYFPVKHFQHKISNNTAGTFNCPTHELDIAASMNVQNNNQGTTEGAFIGLHQSGAGWLDYRELGDLPEGSDVAVHLAGVSNVGASIQVLFGCKRGFVYVDRPRILMSANTLWP